MDPSNIHQMTVTAADQLRSLLKLVRAHELGAREDRDPEDVHQLRVSVRRMRAIVRSDKGLDRELRWFGRSLGAVRDLDVLLARLGTQLATFPPEEAAGGEPLLDALRSERTEARDRMLVVFDSTRYQDLLGALKAATPQSVVDTSAAKAFRSVDKAIAELTTDPPDDDLHELRVKVKRLRYAAELTNGLGPVAQAAKELQTLLGEHQDATVAASTVRRLLKATADPGAAFVAGRLVQAEHECKLWCRSRLAQKLAALRAAAADHPELTTQG
ncbi:CHAD domain-containing protein [Labedaea rhizosphaerae]|uniref:CHAD domain-containing protein n=2 Tax=Labedaea rhizosphaerae TaxID=598644 RepID=A0A4R6SJW7_LABRH|nr:CHAD domain-containing protein [Labedaea rhizosphaerae]